MVFLSQLNSSNIIIIDRAIRFAQSHQRFICRAALLAAGVLAASPWIVLYLRGVCEVWRPGSVIHLRTPIQEKIALTFSPRAMHQLGHEDVICSFARLEHINPSELLELPLENLSCRQLSILTNRTSFLNKLSNEQTSAFLSRTQPRLSADSFSRMEEQGFVQWFLAPDCAPYKKQAISFLDRAAVFKCLNKTTLQDDKEQFNAFFTQLTVSQQGDYFVNSAAAGNPAQLIKKWLDMPDASSLLRHTEAAKTFFNYALLLEVYTLLTKIDQKVLSSLSPNVLSLLIPAALPKYSHEIGFRETAIDGDKLGELIVSFTDVPENAIRALNPFQIEFYLSHLDRLKPKRTDRFVQFFTALTPQQVQNFTPPSLEVMVPFFISKKITLLPDIIQKLNAEQICHFFKRLEHEINHNENIKLACEAFYYVFQFNAALISNQMEDEKILSQKKSLFSETILSFYTKFKTIIDQERLRSSVSWSL